MPFVEGANDGVLNGVTAVTLVPAPDKDRRRVVRTATVFNADAAAVTLTVRLNNNATFRVIFKGSIATGVTWSLKDHAEVIVLDTVNKSLEALLAAAPTTQPDFVSAWGDSS